MKRWKLAAMLAAMALLLCGCGAIVVEESEPVQIGSRPAAQWFW